MCIYICMCIHAVWSDAQSDHRWTHNRMYEAKHRPDTHACKTVRTRNDEGAKHKFHEIVCCTNFMKSFASSCALSMQLTDRGWPRLCSVFTFS